MNAAEELYWSNLRLNQAEFAQKRIYLTSMPRYLSVVLGTRCNINCPYCYQAKTGEELLAPECFGENLRRELAAFYPYLSTLRIGGGEVFLISGFEELVAEVSAAVARPIISISTNGTLIDEAWAERIVRTPFQEVTVSIDGATPGTYARLRRGASLSQVLTNVERIQDLKRRINSNLPDVNFFYLVMRSNYREIPLFLQIAERLGIERISLQMLQVDHRNLSREPGLTAEVDFQPGEVQELHDLTRNVLEEHRKNRTINVCGFQSLFELHNLETDFLEEGRFSLYPDNTGNNSEQASHDSRGTENATGNATETAETSRGTTSEIRLCPNPWTLMYVTETGQVHICFMGKSIGNLYETPLIRLWNSPAAIAARADIINGRYEAAGCSKLWCSWREGKRDNRPAHVAAHELIEEFRRLSQQALGTLEPVPELTLSGSGLASVRRMLTERNHRIAELEWNLVNLCEKNRTMLETADKQNQLLSARISELEHMVSFVSENRVGLASDVRFGSSVLNRILKKMAIGVAIRSIQTLEWASNNLRKFVNWTCVR